MSITVELERLIGVVDAKIDAAGDVKTMDYRQYQQLGEKIMAELAHEEGAFFKDNAHTHSLRMGGVHSTCTSSAIGLLRNWKTAARRRIEKEASNADH